MYGFTGYGTNEYASLRQRAGRGIFATAGTRVVVAMTNFARGVAALTGFDRAVVAMTNFSRTLKI